MHGQPFNFELPVTLHGSDQLFVVHDFEIVKQTTLELTVSTQDRAAITLKEIFKQADL